MYSIRKYFVYIFIVFIFSCLQPLRNFVFLFTLPWETSFSESTFVLKISRLYPAVLNSMFELVTSFFFKIWLTQGIPEVILYKFYSISYCSLRTILWNFHLMTVQDIIVFVTLMLSFVYYVYMWFFVPKLKRKGSILYIEA